MSVKKAFQGVAHALFPESLKHVFNFPDTLSANAVLRIPAVEDLVANLTARDHSISWATVISECVFFMLHMYHGGFTFSNFTVSIAHFLKAMPLRGLLSQVPDFTKWIYNAQADDHSSELNILGVCISALECVRIGGVRISAYVKGYRPVHHAFLACWSVYFISGAIFWCDKPTFRVRC
jgi:hypothetical protein